jgi:hypothetical protein
MFSFLALARSDGRNLRLREGILVGQDLRIPLIGILEGKTLFAAVVMKRTDLFDESAKWTFEGASLESWTTIFFLDLLRNCLEGQRRFVLRDLVLFLVLRLELESSLPQLPPAAGTAMPQRISLNERALT